MLLETTAKSWRIAHAATVYRTPTHNTCTPHTANRLWYLDSNILRVQVFSLIDPRRPARTAEA